MQAAADTSTTSAARSGLRHPWMRLLLLFAAGCVVLAAILAWATDHRRQRSAMLSASRYAEVLQQTQGVNPAQGPQDPVMQPDPSLPRGHKLAAAAMPDPWPADWEQRTVIRAYTEPVPGLLRQAGRAVVVSVGSAFRAEWMPCTQFQEQWEGQERDRRRFSSARPE